MHIEIVEGHVPGESESDRPPDPHVLVGWTRVPVDKADGEVTRLWWMDRHRERVAARHEATADIELVDAERTDHHVARR